MNNNKRKGRTRIKLDAKKIALAKQLILREATTTVIANELNISRTFAWRLRKNLVNGISLHERVIDPLDEDGDAEAAQNPQGAAVNPDKNGKGNKNVNITKDLKNGIDTAVNSKQEAGQQQMLIKQEEQHELNSVIQRSERVVQMHQLMHSSSKALEQMQKLQKQQQQQFQLIDSHVQQMPSQQEQHCSQYENSNEIDNNHEVQSIQHHQLNNAVVGDNNLNHLNSLKPHINKLSEHQQFYLPAVGKQASSATAITHGSEQNGQLPILTQFTSAATSSTTNQLPVNLSIRSIQTMQNNNLSISSKKINTANAATVASKKKPRKPNVFIDDEKYDMAKLLVTQNSSTMEIAKALNVSQMTAWKLRDAIIKGIPLSYRSKREMRQQQHANERSDISYNDSANANGSNSITGAVVQLDVGVCPNDVEANNESQQQQADNFLIQQRLKATHQLPLLQQRQSQHQHQLQQLLQRQQQTNDSREKQKNHNHHQQQPHPPEESLHKSPSLHPRRRLKAVEREMRDREVTREILELIKEDNNIQYWKVSARLAEKGYAISPSSVCQKLKSLGIHRRWKQGDKPLLLEIEQLKTTNAGAAILSLTPTLSAITTHQVAAANALTVNDNYDRHQFGIDGGHFLSALTR